MEKPSWIREMEQRIREVQQMKAQRDTLLQALEAFPQQQPISAYAGRLHREAHDRNYISETLRWWQQTAGLMPGSCGATEDEVHKPLPDDFDLRAVDILDFVGLGEGTR